MGTLFKLGTLGLIAGVMILSITSICYGSSISDDLANLIANSLISLYDFAQCHGVMASVDYMNPTTRNFFLSLIPYDHGGPYNVAQICDIWDYCNAHWIYVSDPEKEYFARASETILNGFRGDCDDFAVLMAAGVRAIGGTARIVLEKTPSAGHAYSEVYIAKRNTWNVTLRYLSERYPNADSFHYHEGIDGQIWLNLDYQYNTLAAHRHPGGPFLLGGDNVIWICDGD